MPTDPYKYRFHLTEKTLARIRILDEEGWQNLFGMIIRGKSVPYNIDFSELDPVTRLCELYSIIVTQRLETRTYQAALTRMLTEYYGNGREAGLIFTLIKVLDYVKPSQYYNRLQLLVIKPEYAAAMINTKAPDGFSIHFHLVNALMSFDTDRKLLDFLLSLRKSEQHPEYYQVTIRYLYSYCGQPQFDAFMNAVFERLGNKQIRAFVVNTFDEYVFYKKELGLFYCWFFKERQRLAAGDLQPIVMALAHDMMTWLQKSGDEYTGFKGYNECRAYLATFFKDRFSLAEDQLDQLKNADEADVYYRDELMEVLGITYWKWKVVWKKPDEMTEIFEDGQRRGKQNHYRQASKTEWSIPDSEVLKSEREDERRAVNFGN